MKSFHALPVLLGVKVMSKLAVVPFWAVTLAVILLRTLFTTLALLLTVFNTEFTSLALLPNTPSKESMLFMIPSKALTVTPSPSNAF